MNVIEFTPEQITELAQDPNLEAIYAGTILIDQTFYKVHDNPSITEAVCTMEAGDEVLVTKHKDGTYFMHFMSLTPNMYHYKAPWISDDQVTHDEGALYHV